MNDRPAGSYVIPEGKKKPVPNLADEAMKARHEQQAGDKKEEVKGND